MKYMTRSLKDVFVLLSDYKKGINRRSETFCKLCQEGQSKRWHVV